MKRFIMFLAVVFIFSTIYGTSPLFGNTLTSANSSVQDPKHPPKPPRLHHPPSPKKPAKIHEPKKPKGPKKPGQPHPPKGPKKPKHPPKPPHP